MVFFNSPAAFPAMCFSTCPAVTWLRLSARKKRLCHLLLLAAVCSPAGVWADVFVLREGDGGMTLSDRASDARFVLLQSTGLAALQGPVFPQPCTSDMLRVADVPGAAGRSGVDMALLYAVIDVESRCKANAVSGKGAIGLMQLMPQTARQYGVVNLKDPAENVRAGSQHLRSLLDQFEGDTALALAAYNAGAATVWSYGRKIPPYLETRRYVPAVLKRLAAFRAGNSVADNRP
jgi:hypothetical protein